MERGYFGLLLTNFTPNIKSIMEERQSQPSH